MILNCSLYQGRLLRLGIVLLLAGCALLFQSCGEQTLTQAEFLKHLDGQGIETGVMGPATAPLTIRGTRVRLSGATLAQPAEIQVYEDVDGAVRIDNNTITSQATMQIDQWQPYGRGGLVTTESAPTVIDVSQWPVPLHVFQQGHLVVLYPDNDPSVLRALTEVIGPPVAGPAG